MTTMPTKSNRKATPKSDDTLTQQRDRWLMAALPDVPFDGWTTALMTRAAEKAGVDAATLFPNGIAQALDHFADWADRAMLADLEKHDLKNMRVRDRIAAGVMARLDTLAPHKQAVNAALGQGLRPRILTRRPRWLWRTADRLWWAVGDAATDYNHYSKRFLLSGVIASTTLFWLADTSDNHEDTRGFLDRRIDEVLKVGRGLGQLIARLGGKTGAVALAFLLTTTTPLQASAPLVCPQDTSGPVSIEFTHTEPRVTHNLSHQDLGKFSVSTTFSHHREEVFLTGGITESNIKSNFEVSFNQRSNRETGETCISINKVEMKLSYEPVVHIASNFPRDSCQFATTWEHELRHVNTDLLTLQERGRLLQQAAQGVASQIKTIGPVQKGDVKKVQQEIITRINTAVSTAFDEIDRLRMQRQQLIDTREEYMRLSKACPPVHAGQQKR